MMRTRKFQSWIPACAVLSLLVWGLAPAAFAAPPESGTAAPAQDVMLKVEVFEGTGAEPTVKVNMPLSLMEAFLSSVSTEEGQEGAASHCLGMNIGAELKEEGIDLQKLWQSVKDIPTAELLTVEKEGEHVRVWKDETHFRVDVREEGAEKTKVQVSLPLALVDALCSGEAGELDWGAFISAARNHAPMTLVELEEPDSRVRIWLE